ncbi:MAG: peptidylprolyl isomerase [Myxococcota bacterium]|jgi:cyclophilin family peptidyl-prolyl cis-trans isomerase/HEAT repeat protein|nr:peptidylprolyl isomerase [Myxococcota bacterium]
MKSKTLFFLVALGMGCAPRAAIMSVEPTAAGKPLDPMAVIASAEDSRTVSVALQELVGSADAELRRLAVLALGRIGDAHSLGLLVQALADPDAKVRRTAAFAAGLNCPKDEPELKTRVGRALGDEKDASALIAMLKACGRCGCPQLASAISAHSKSADPALREAALLGLGLAGQVGNPVDTALLELAAAGLSDPVDAVRLAAAFALTRTVAVEMAKTPPNVAEQLARVAAQDSNSEVRYHALRALARRELLSEALLLGALSHKEPIVQAGGAIGLSLAGKQACKLAPKALALLVKKAMADSTLVDSPLGHSLRAVLEFLLTCERSSEASRTASSLASALEARGPLPKASTALVACLARSLGQADDMRLLSCDPQRPDTGKRLLAQRLARRAPHDAVALESLSQMVRDDDPAPAVAAVSALAEVGTAAAGAAITQALSDPRAIVVAAAFDALAQGKGDDLPVEDMAKAIEVWRQSPTHHAVLLSAIGAFAKAKGAAGTDTLRELAKDKRPEIRRAALLALSARGAAPAGVLPPLSPPHSVSSEDLIAWKKRQVTARLATTRGDIEIELWPDIAPGTVASFYELAEQGFYDDTPIHRVVPGFVVQAGDPTGTGGGDPGYSLRCELSETPYDRGVVGMALSGRDTGGSQFFVTLSAQPHLEGQYTAFGKVTFGMDVVEQIEEGDRLRAVVVTGLP